VRRVEPVQVQHLDIAASDETPSRLASGQGNGFPLRSAAESGSTTFVQARREAISRETIAASHARTPKALRNTTRGRLIASLANRFATRTNPAVQIPMFTSRSFDSAEFGVRRERN
jgi:hypothetical protein